MNVISVGTVDLSGGKVLTISGGANDYFVFNISQKVKMSGGSSWNLVGVDPSRVIFNMLPGSTEFSGAGGSSFTSGGIILAPHSGTKVTLTGASVIVGKVSTEFSQTGGSQLLGNTCK